MTDFPELLRAMVLHFPLTLRHPGDEEKYFFQVINWVQEKELFRENIIRWSDKEKVRRDSGLDHMVALSFRS